MQQIIRFQARLALAMCVVVGSYTGCSESDNEDEISELGTETETDTATPQGTDEQDTDSGDEYPDVDPLIVGFPVFEVCLGVNHDYTALFGDSHEVMISDSYDLAELFRAATENDIEKTGYAIGNFNKLDPTTAAAGKKTICLTSMLM